MTKRVFLTGGTGFIGEALVAALRRRGDEVIVLSRNPGAAHAKLGDAVEIVAGDPNIAGPWQARLAGVDAVVNLAGASVAAQRWNAHFKQILHDSRVESTRHVVEGMAALAESERPGVLVSASGIDFYPFAEDLSAARGFAEDDAVTESSPPGSTFLARVCRNWEAEADRAMDLGVRVVLMRTGVVLAEGGGPLDKLALPFRMFAGGHIGSGKQWFSWIHRDDAVKAYLFAIDHDDLAGPVNLVAPDTVRAGEFARALGAAMHRPAWLPVPGFAVKLAAGEFAEHLLHGRRARPAALLDHGFEFEFPAVQPAVDKIFAGR
jgi:uncharacterized protein (TIGR01777 family)